MSLLRILTVVGARPQFIKAAPVSKALQKAGIEEYMVHTGQHYDAEMSEVFFDELRIPVPKRNLGVGSGTHAVQTAGILVGVEQAILEYVPDWVLVYGDTNSTIGGALAAAKLQVRLAHVEAGLRSFNRKMAEEINRILTDHASDLLFAPTLQAVHNLKKEGISDDRVSLVGDVMYDAALYYNVISDEKSTAVRDLGLQPKEYVLCTIHRAENTDDEARLRAIVEGLVLTARIIPIIVPVHPRTRNALQTFDLVSRLESAVRVVEPLGFLDTINLVKNARLIVTDSGGMQKEAYFHKVPCVTLRDDTEWNELVEQGCNTLVPPRCGGQVAEEIAAVMSKRPPRFDFPHYGDGRASEKIAQALLARAPHH